MRVNQLVAAVGLLIFCAVANAATQLGVDDARHLLNRIGFSASKSDIDAYAKLTREQAVDRLLGETRREATTPAPSFATAAFESFRRVRNLTPEERQALQRERREQGLQLKGWWLGEMRVTPSPLTERMTLFW